MTELLPLTGVFEGYLKKHKSVNSLTLFIEYNKRYFTLNLSQFRLSYFKNRKKTGRGEEIPLREVLAVQKFGEDLNITKANGKSDWGFEFYVITRSRTYRFNAYSYDDREVWFSALQNMIDYKKRILESRGITLNDQEINVDSPPKDQVKYDILSSDFDENGLIISPGEVNNRYEQF